MNKKQVISLILAVFTLTFVVTTVFALSGSKAYHGTTVTYTNNINVQTATNWNASYKDTTSPSFSMDTFGVSVWTTYVKCGTVIVNSTYHTYTVDVYPYLYKKNVTSTTDQMAKTKPTCNGKTRTLVNYIQHYWQDGSFSGDGGTLSQTRID